MQTTVFVLETNIASDVTISHNQKNNAKTVL